MAGAHPSDFRVLLDECTNHALAPAGACTVRIRFAPKAAGARTATLTAGGKTASLWGTGEQTTSGGTGSQPPASNPSSPPPAPPPSAPGDLVAPHIAELTKAVQRIAAARAGKLTVGLRTDEPGTWKVEVFGEGPLARASAARRLIGTATRSLAAGGTYSLKVSLKRAARTRLKRLRTAKLLIRSTVTDSSGNAAASTRRVTPKR